VEQNLPLSGHEHMLDIRWEQGREYMLLDKWTRKNLEITESLRGTEKGTLYSILNLTKTAYGGRLLREWLNRPLVNREAVLKRQERVAALADDTFLRQDLRQQLTTVYDLERLLSKLACGRGNARDLLALGRTLSTLPALRELLGTGPEVLTDYARALEGLDILAEELAAAIAEDAPPALKDGGLLRDGWHPQVDELRALANGGKDWIAALESTERERTKIRALKIGYTRVFGYYIEVTRANASLVPPDYQRRQTLANAERFTTPELKEYEQKVTSAEEKLFVLEYELFLELRDRVFAAAGAIMGAARALAELDVFAALAESAAQNRYTRPEIKATGDLMIQGGRHPVIEKLSPELNFVPNDTLLTDKKHLALITGPNMAGKSTYMRQVALIALMAQVGSFVPATKAALPMIDCIFTRVGASDNLAEGQSTFMVEMREVAHILRFATARSLVILDEVGRGTATFDGLSLAWALAEHLVNRPETAAKTLFATHYHELTQLEGNLPGIFNLHVAVQDEGGDVVFLHKILPGSADRSYGLHVAKIAGLPREVLERAARILEELENSDQHRRKIRAAREKVVQPALFETPPEHPLLVELRQLPLDDMTSRQALDYLYDRQRQLRGEG
jgi:DNA mismatch repair protein MutS